MPEGAGHPTAFVPLLNKTEPIIIIWLTGN